jgi:hypothetical protein
MGAAVDRLRELSGSIAGFTLFAGAAAPHPSGATAAGCPVLAAVDGRVDRGRDHCERARR